MSVTFVYRQKIDFSICVVKVGFPKYSHKSSPNVSLIQYAYLIEIPLEEKCYYGTYIMLWDCSCC